MTQPQDQPPEATGKGTAVMVPMASGSPTAFEMKRRRRRRSRLLSTTSSVMSAAAAGIPSAEKNKLSNNEALMHLVKATIGGSFLAMPEAFHNAGIIMGTVGTAVIGLSVLNTLVIIVRCSQALRSGKYAAAVLASQKSNNADADAADGDKGSVKLPAYTHYDSKELLLPPMDYPETAGAVFEYGARGRFARWAPLVRKITSVSLVMTYYGVNIIYVCIVATTCKQLVDQYTANSDVDSWWSAMHGISIRWYPSIVALIIVSVGMVRLIKYLVPFSVAANACMLISTVVIFYFIIFGDDGREPLHPAEQAKLVVWPPTRWTLFAGSALCSLEGVGMLLHVENAMSRPLELAGPPAYTLHKSMFVIIILNILLGVSGYMRYGDRCTGSIALNLPNNKLSDAIKITVVVAVVLTYGLQLTVTADLGWQALRKKITGTAKEAPNDDDLEETVDEEEWTPKLTLCYYGMRLVLILGSILVATAVPDIGPLVSLVGSVGFSMLGLIIPVAMEIVWNWYPREDDGDAGPEVVRRGAANGAGAAAESATNADGRKGHGDGDGDDTAGRRRCGYARVLRNAKNAGLLVLAVCSLVGGAYFNVVDIIDLAAGSFKQ